MPCRFPGPIGKLRGIWCRPTLKGEVEGDLAGGCLLWGCLLWGACSRGGLLWGLLWRGTYSRGVPALGGRGLLLRAVCILLECILV